jgi:hypothetical protein
MRRATQRDAKNVRSAETLREQLGEGHALERRKIGHPVAAQPQIAGR